MEHLIIRLGNYTENIENIPYIPSDDKNAPRTRTAYGWKPGMTPEESWLAAQGWWRLRADRAVNADLAVVTVNNTIVAVAHVDGVVKGGGHRNWILGKLDTSGRYDPWLGKTLRLNDSRNPIAYLDADDFTPPENVTEDTVFIN